MARALSSQIKGLPRRRVAALAVIGLVSLSAFGCQTSSQRRTTIRATKDALYKAHDPQNRALAANLIQLKSIDTKIKRDLDQRFAEVVSHLPPEQRTRFYDALRKKVNLTTIREEIVDIYTESLDRQQLTKLVAFYRSDLGQFITNTEPKLNASIFDSLSSSSTQEAERILLEMISEKKPPEFEEARTPIRKALDKLLFAH